jgi:hypothetical protein
MHRGLTGNTYQVTVYRDSWNPGEALAGEDQRPRVALFSGNARVDQDVLQLARTPATGGSHSQAGAAKSQMHMHAGPQVCCVDIVTAGATFDVEPGSGAGDRWGNDFHIGAHDTKTPTSRKVDASTARSASYEVEHRGEVRPRQCGLRTSGTRVQSSQQLDRDRFSHQRHIRRRGHAGGEQRIYLELDGLLHRRRPARRAVEPEADARTIAFEGGKNHVSHARARVMEVGVRRVGIGGDSALLEELDDLSSPGPEHRTDVRTAARGHAAQARKTASPHQVQNGAFNHIVSRVSKCDNIRGDSCSRPLQEVIAKGARAGLDRTARHE